MPLTLTLTAETPEEIVKWRPLIDAFSAGAAGNGKHHEPVDAPKATPTLVTAPRKPDPQQVITTKAGKPVANASGVELVKDLKDAGWSATIIGLRLDQLRELYVGYATDDDAVLAKYPKAPPPVAKVEEEAPPAKPTTPRAPPAAPAMPKAGPVPPKKGAAAKPLPADDEEVEPAPQPPKKGGTPVVAKAPVAQAKAAAAKRVEEPKVLERAPLPAKKGSPGVLGRVSADNIPGAMDVDPDDEDQPEEEPEEETEVIEEGDEDQPPEEEVEEEIDDAPPADLPKIVKSKIPQELLGAERMRNVIAVIQRHHGTSDPAAIYRYMLAYAQHVPKIQGHLDAEGSAERMTARIANIIAAMAPGR